MQSRIRRLRGHLTYANVAATLALVFAMSGGAMAANHYLISSTKQLSPSVVKKLKGRTGARGATGAAGTAGAAGPQGIQGLQGPRGLQGEAGETPAKLLAALKAEAGVTRSQGLVSDTKTGTGTYQLTWETNIKDCYPSATSFAVPSFVVVTGIANNVISISTFNAANAPTDEPFYIQIFC